MKQDYARTIGYLALLILFIQILPFGPFFRVVATAICSFILIGIAFSISNLSRIEKRESKKEDIPQRNIVEEKTEEPDQLIIVEEFETEVPTTHYEEREQ